MNKINEFVDDKLFELRDEKYREFQKPLLPSVPENRLIGVRTPVLRRFANSFVKSDEAAEFMKALPHTSYDADNLHAFLIEKIKDFDACIKSLDTFLPYIDNWATCDMMSPKILAKHTEDLLPHIDRWLVSQYTYEIRFGILSLMRYYIEDNFEPTVLEKVVSVKSDEYYVNMARAWFFATALATQWDSVIKIIEDNALDTFTHNKTIQKAVESYRITDEQKRILKTMKRK